MPAQSSSHRLHGPKHRDRIWLRNLASQRQYTWIKKRSVMPPKTTMHLRPLLNNGFFATWFNMSKLSVDDYDIVRPYVAISLGTRSSIFRKFKPDHSFKSIQRLCQNARNSVRGLLQELFDIIHCNQGGRG